jgi:hypothetical protein
VGLSLTAFLGLGVSARVVQAQSRPSAAVIDGAVSDTNLISLSDATVSILGSNVHVATGANGRFRITRLAAGQYLVVVHHLGYVPMSTSIQVADGDTLRVSFMLRQIATALDTVVIAAKSLGARMTEFEERRKLGFGHFLTQADIEQRNSVFLGDLLAVVPSIKIQEGPSSQAAYSARGQLCPFQVFVDGVYFAPTEPPPPPVPTQGPGLGRTPPQGTNLLELPPVSNIAGIEIYSGPSTIPLQYQRLDAGCGVILIWTKAGP